ncbi:MAG: transporter substrate-binding protein [Ilumatobacteraceae bacterium]|nr:transporter substrate-binding protein [Ilumatobacteraceae bacterium]
MSCFTHRFVRVALPTAFAFVALAACSSSGTKTVETLPTLGNVGVLPPTSTSAPGATSTTAVSSSPTSPAVTDSSEVGVVPTPAGAPFSVDTPSGTLSLPGKPTKIVSLSPSATETLFAIGAGAQVVAVDAGSDAPAAASAVATSLSSATPDLATVTGYTPDLVVITDDSSGIGERLVAAGVPVYVASPAQSLDDVYAQIGQLGALTGHVTEAATLVSTMESGITAALAQLPDTEAQLTYFHETDPALHTVTSDSLAGQIYSLAGLIDIADSAESASTPPQLDASFVISADPQIIFLADGETPAAVAARTGWAGIAAVKTGDVVSVDGEIASRWGPRVVDYVRAVVAAANHAASHDSNQTAATPTS